MPTPPTTTTPILRMPKSAPREIAVWVPYLMRALRARRHHHALATTDHLTLLAARLYLCGPPDAPHMGKVYTAYTRLCFSWRRIRQLKSLLEQLPVTAAEIQQLARMLEAAEAIESVEQADFPVRTVLGLAQRITDHPAYIAAAKTLHTPPWRIRSIYHPNTHAYALQRFRGLVPPDPEGEGAARRAAALQTVHSVE